VELDPPTDRLTVTQTRYLRVIHPREPCEDGLRDGKALFT